MAIDLKQKKIVCLGGGIGTVNLVKGLQEYTDNLTVIASVADDGGSAGRIRRLYNILPPGDVVSCIAALSKSENPLYPKLLTYRFPGDRYSRDKHLSGHKLGNLMMVAAIDVTGSFDGAIQLMKEMFDVSHQIYTATKDPVSLSAITADGIEVQGEEHIDLGKYKGKRILDRVYLTPENPATSEGVVQAINEADVIIAGPGDLYTTILPTLLVPAITEAITKSNACKIFVVNVANKPFETKGYHVSNFIKAIEKHLDKFPFTKVIINDNLSHAIPKPYKYTFVENDLEEAIASYQIICADLVDESFPLYHDNQKLAKVVAENV